MKHFFLSVRFFPALARASAVAALLAPPLLAPSPALAQDLTNAGSLVSVSPGGLLYIGSGGLTNLSGGTLTNQGTMRVDGPLRNAGTLDLSSGALEVRSDVNNTAGTVLPGTGVVSFTGAADQLLTAAGATLYQLRVDKATAGANTVRLAGDVIVSNAVSLLNGLMHTGSGTTLSTLRLPNGATLNGEAPGRYVLGNVAITRLNVSGTPLDFGHGFTLDPLTNTLASVVVTRTAGLLVADLSYGQNIANAAFKGIDRIWTVAPGSTPAGPVALSLRWIADNDNGLTSFTQARAFQQTAQGQPWAVRGPVTDASLSRSVALAGAALTASPLSRFTVSNAANPLPVTLLEFTAKAEGPAAVRLDWVTATERDNAGFTVERSRDGNGFSAIGTQPGAGTSQARHAYTLLDTHLPAGVSLLYYRVRQNDADGTLTYSPVRTVALSRQAAGFVVYPTRVNVGEGAQYLYTGPSEPGRLEMFNIVGQSLRTVQLDGRPTGTVPLTGFATGVYLLRYTGAAGRFITRLVVE